MSWLLPDQDRQADSQSGAGGTAHQLIVPLYFQRYAGGRQFAGRHLGIGSSRAGFVALIGAAAWSAGSYRVTLVAGFLGHTHGHMDLIRIEGVIYQHSSAEMRVLSNRILMCHTTFFIALRLTR